MILWLLVGMVGILLAINISLWKFGFVQDAERLEKIEDKPVGDAKERKAVLKRIERWREEGKLTRAEYERILELCRLEWDPS